MMGRPRRGLGGQVRDPRWYTQMQTLAHQQGPRPRRDEQGQRDEQGSSTCDDLTIKVTAEGLDILLPPRSHFFL